jgi:predicted metallopeptidase
MMRRTKSRPKGKIAWHEADDIKDRVHFLMDRINLSFDKTNIYFRRSINANTRAYARIWGLGRVWQETLNLKPSYLIEVISEKFDDLPQDKKDEILLHELAHIPMNFSGSLMPHKHKGPGNFHDKLKDMITTYKKGK